MSSLARFAETALVDLGVQGGEEQVLQHRAIIGIAAVPIVIPQQAGDLRLDEQVAGNQSLLLDEPDEQQTGDEADDVLFGAQGSGLIGGKPGLFDVDGAVEPGEQILVEPPVEFLGVQFVQPGGQQAVKIVLLVVGVHPFRALGQRELGQNVQMGAVGIGRVNLPYERHFAQHIALRGALVLAAVDEGHSEQIACLRRAVLGRQVGGSEQNDGGLAQALVDLAGELRVLATWVGCFLQFHGEEDKALLLSLVEGSGLKPKRLLID